MEDELIYVKKPTFSNSVLLYNIVSNKIFKCFTVIILIIALIRFIQEINYISSFINEVLAFIFMFCFLFFMLYFRYAGEIESKYNRTKYLIYQDKFVIETEKFLKKDRKALSADDVADIVITQTNAQKMNNLSDIRFITKNPNAPIDFCFENVDDAALVKEHILSVLKNKTIIDEEENEVEYDVQNNYGNDELIMVINPVFSPFRKVKPISFNILKIIIILVYFGIVYIGISLIKGTFDFAEILNRIIGNPFVQTIMHIKNKPGFNFLNIFILLFISIIYTIKLKQVCDNTSYIICRDRIIFEEKARILNSKILKISDIKDVELFQTSWQKKHNLGTVYITAIDTATEDDVLYDLINIENPNLVCAQIKELMALNTQTNE